MKYFYLGILVFLISACSNSLDSTFTPTKVTESPRYTSTPSPVPYIIVGQIANLRSCPETSCDVIVQAFNGDKIGILDNNINGENILSGTRWVRGVFNGEIVYLHSDLVVLESDMPTVTINGTVTPTRRGPRIIATPTTRPTFGFSSQQAVPTATRTLIPTHITTSSNSTSSRPRNCSTAVAMGLSAQEAGQYSHLDRDNDGVACYGD